MNPEIAAESKRKKHTASFSDVNTEIEQLYEAIPLLRSFNIIRKIGEGTFSSVYMAKGKVRRSGGGEEEMLAVKYLIPTSHPLRIAAEVQCLMEAGGVDNVMEVLQCLRNKDHVVIIMPYLEHEVFSEVVSVMDVMEVREYMRNLLVSLLRIHKLGIIHRDVKPSNFLYCRKQQRYALVDFGLAQGTPDTCIPLLRRLQETVGLSGSIYQKRAGARLAKANNIITTTTTMQKQGKSAQLMKSSVNYNEECKASKLTNGAPHVAAMTAKKAVAPPNVMPRCALQEKTCSCFGYDQVCKLCLASFVHEAIQKYKHRHNFNREDGYKLSNQWKDVLNQKPTAVSAGWYAWVPSPRGSTKVALSNHSVFVTLNTVVCEIAAIDIWSTGIIFLCLLSGRYPFFKTSDDLTALAQIIALRGSAEVAAAAKACGKMMICSRHCRTTDLKELCERLRGDASVKAVPDADQAKTPAEKRRKTDAHVETSPTAGTDGTDGGVDASRYPARLTLPSDARDASSVRGGLEAAPGRDWRCNDVLAFDLLYKLLDPNPHTRINAAEALRHQFFVR